MIGLYDDTFNTVWYSLINSQCHSRDPTAKLSSFMEQLEQCVEGKTPHRVFAYSDTVFAFPPHLCSFFFLNPFEHIWFNFRTVRDSAYFSSLHRPFPATPSRGHFEKRKLEQKEFTAVCVFNSKNQNALVEKRGVPFPLLTVTGCYTLSVSLLR